MAGETLELNNDVFLSNTVIAGTNGGIGGGAHVDNATNADTAAAVADSLFENNRCLNHCYGGGLSVFGELRAKETAFINNYATASSRPLLLSTLASMPV